MWTVFNQPRCLKDFIENVMLKFFCSICMYYREAYQPVEPHHVLSKLVVERYVTFRGFTQRVDVLPRFPAVLLCRPIVIQRPNNTDFTDDPPHHLMISDQRGKTGKSFSCGVELEQVKIVNFREIEKILPQCRWDDHLGRSSQKTGHFQQPQVAKKNICNALGPWRDKISKSLDI